MDNERALVETCSLAHMRFRVSATEAMIMPEVVVGWRDGEWEQTRFPGRVVSKCLIEFSFADFLCPSSTCCCCIMFTKPSDRQLVSITR